MALFMLAVVHDARGAIAEDPPAVRRLIDAGAVEVALTRIDALQPRDRVAADWMRWEALRCEALARLRRPAVLLERVRELPSAAPEPLTACFVEGARAALAQNEPQLAREYAARVLWQSSPTPAEAKALRLTVIESYIGERRGDEAFRSMLRFQQDYSPLERRIAESFAEGLLELGLDREALNWLGPMDEVSPGRLALQLRSGTLSPDAVITQARAAVVRDRDPRYWRVIHEAGVKTRNGALQIEALEHLLQDADARDTGAIAAAAQRLWQGYSDVATDVGNREQLLMGDDGAWSDYAARRQGSEPYLARAVYGYLARRAQNEDIRRSAQLQLALSLSSARLDDAALRLMQYGGLDLAALDTHTRYRLGNIAARRNDAALALKLWQGLSAPVDVNAIQWQLTLGRAALQAGDEDALNEAVKRVLDGRAAVSAELTQSLLQFAQEMLDLRKLDSAETLYELLLPIAPETRAREVLFGLGRTQELRGERVSAAASYLRAALFTPATVADTLALQARLLAALNLMRAGLRDDARAQFDWLVKNAKDPALVETAKRGLGRL
jgi:hypothetical protein